MVLYFVTLVPVPAIELIDNVLLLNIDMSSQLGFSLVESDNPFVEDGIYIYGDSSLVFDMGLALWTMAIPFDANISFSLVWDTEKKGEFQLLEANMALLSELYLQLGKQDIQLGYGNFIQPLSFFPASPSRIDWLRGNFHWAVYLRYDFPQSSINIYALVDPESIELQRDAQWAAALLNTEFYPAGLEFTLGAGYLYTRTKNVPEHALEFALGGQADLLELFAIHTATSFQYLLRFSLNNEIILSDPPVYNPDFLLGLTISFIDPDVVFSLAPELFYRDTPSLGVSTVLEAGDISINVSPQFALEEDRVLFQASLFHSPHKYFKHGITFRHNSQDNSIPLLMTYSVQGRL